MDYFLENNVDEIKSGYTRVTEILSMWQNFDGIPKNILENKKKIGHDVHAAISNQLEFLPISLPSEEIEGYYRSFDEWMRATQCSCQNVEQRLYCDDLKITGKYDMLASFPHESGFVLVDWKTCASCDSELEKIWQMQAIFYMYLLKKNEPERSADRALFVILNKHGKVPKVKEFIFTNDLMDTAYGLYRAYKYFGIKKS